MSILFLIAGVLSLALDATLLLAGLVASVTGADLLELIQQPQFWALVIGPLTPLLVSVVKQPSFSPGVRRVVAVTVALVLGAMTVAAVGQFNLADLLTTFGLVLAASQLAYKKVWRESLVNAEIEAATNIGGGVDFEPDGEWDEDDYPSA